MTENFKNVQEIKDFLTSKKLFPFDIEINEINAQEIKENAEEVISNYNCTELLENLKTQDFDNKNAHYDWGCSNAKSKNLEDYLNTLIDIAIDRIEEEEEYFALKSLKQNYERVRQELEYDNDCIISVSNYKGWARNIIVKYNDEVIFRDHITGYPNEDFKHNEISFNDYVLMNLDVDKILEIIEEIKENEN
jgi:hypothetical protein